MDLDVIRRCYHGKMEITPELMAAAAASNHKQNELVNALKDRTNAQGLVSRRGGPYSVAWDRDTTTAVIDGQEFELGADFWRKKSWLKAERVGMYFILTGKLNHKAGLAFNRAMEPILSGISSAAKQYPDSIHYLLNEVNVQHGFKTMRVLNARGSGISTSAFLHGNTLYVRIPKGDWGEDDNAKFVPPEGFTEMTPGQHLDIWLEHTELEQADETY